MWKLLAPAIAECSKECIADWNISLWYDSSPSTMTKVIVCVYKSAAEGNSFATRLAKAAAKVTVLVHKFVMVTLKPTPFRKVCDDLLKDKSAEAKRLQKRWTVLLWIDKKAREIKVSGTTENVAAVKSVFKTAYA